MEVVVPTGGGGAIVGDEAIDGVGGVASVQGIDVGCGTTGG